MSKEKTVKVNVEYTVLNSDGEFVRTYSEETHGDLAESYAKEYSQKIGGSIK